MDTVWVVQCWAALDDAASLTAAYPTRELARAGLERDGFTVANETGEELSAEKAGHTPSGDLFVTVLPVPFHGGA